MSPCFIKKAGGLFFKGEDNKKAIIHILGDIY